MAFERPKKRCRFCRDKVEWIDYKDYKSFERALSDKGKLRSRKVSGACRGHQSQLANSVKVARELGLLPYVVEG